MTTLIFELFGRDNSASRVFDEVGRSSDGAGRRLSEMGDDAKDADGPLDHLRNTVNKLGSSLLDKVKGAAQFGIKVGAITSTAITVAPLLAKVAGQIISVGQASLAAAPGLLALVAGGLLVKATLTQIGPAIGKAMEPVTTSFTAAGVAASALATKGVRPLAAEFAKVGMPIIASGMNRIATATNGVVTSTLRWASSAAGLSAIRNTVNATSSATEMLGPHIDRVVQSLGNMIGRIAGVSLAAGSSGLAGVLDKLSAWMDRVNAATVQGGLDTLKAKYLAVKSAIEQAVAWVKTAITFWHEHRTAIMAVQDALSILAIAFGGPVVAATAAVGLIIRHWSDLKAAWQSVTQAFTGSTVGAGFLDNLQKAAQTVLPPLQAAFNQIKAAVMPVLTEIWDKIQNQLIPAFGSFIAAIAPVVGFLISVLGPTVAMVFTDILNIISGVLNIISGVFNVFAGLLTGNWSQVWEGIKQIFSGAWEVIINLLKLYIFDRIGALLGGLPGFLGGLIGRAARAGADAFTGEFGVLISFARGIPGRITGALGDLGSLLYTAGRNVIIGLINGIKSMIGAVGSAIGSVASKIRNALPFSPAKEGPLSGSGSPDIAGAKIPAMIAAGMLGGLGGVSAAAYRLAGATALTGLGTAGLPALPYPAMATTGPGAAGPLAVNLSFAPGRSRFEDLIIEMFREYVRAKGGGSVQTALGT